MTGHAQDKTEGSLSTLQQQHFSSVTSDLRQSRDNIEHLLIYKRTIAKDEHFSIDTLHDLKKKYDHRTYSRLSVI